MIKKLDFLKHDNVRVFVTRAEIFMVEGVAAEAMCVFCWISSGVESGFGDIPDHGEGG